MDLTDEIKNNVRLALAEDIGACDYTALLIAEEKKIIADVICRDDAVLCGTHWFDACFQQLSSATLVRWYCKDGDVLSAGQKICEVEGHARALLTAERTALNFLQTLSATATKTRCYVDRVSGTGAKIVDTRKTLPGLRLAQKYAVKCGGGVNHRLGLYDGILIKENHVIATGGIEQALHKANAIAPSGVFIQVEVETMDELRLALSAGAKMVLLDNFSLDQLRAAVILTQQLVGKPTLLEASGNISLKNVKAVAETGVDRISIGSLTKDVMAVDLSMRFQLF
ncbi:MAG: carboxylating nicotinate-nucleotide diphosphorylase [Nitrosomonas sp.]|nr:carboxylating nicotinate-nucleotide diphosphorylase [Nitrosomonas sp.]MDP1949704.1 carboxylating nicotinate-nucleotide diphosphorylase [Nitrosomonas sp.]